MWCRFICTSSLQSKQPATSRSGRLVTRGGANAAEGLILLQGGTTKTSSFLGRLVNEIVGWRCSQRKTRRFTPKGEGGTDTTLADAAVGVADGAKLVQGDDGSEPSGLDVLFDDALLETAEDKLGRVDGFVLHLLVIFAIIVVTVVKDLVFEDRLETEAGIATGEAAPPMAEGGTTLTGGGEGQDDVAEDDFLVDNEVIFIIDIIVGPIKVDDAGQLIEEETFGALVGYGPDAGRSIVSLRTERLVILLSGSGGPNAVSTD